MMGEARVTSILAGSLSSVTVRGAEITLASAFLFRKENTAATPSASRKAVAGLKPLAVSNNILGSDCERVSFTDEFAGLTWRLLPKARCWACSVPDQSKPLEVFGLIEVSSKRASI